ncbi:MAG TPA: hypothetical protein VIT85_06820 [Solirubrobacterales bacterium]
MSMPLAADADPPELREPPVPPGFRLGATNGYTVTVLGLPGDVGERDAVYLVVERPGAVVYYFARDVAVTETSIKADLGSVAQIDMSFAATGKERSQPSPCGGGRVAIDSGRYEGSFSFHGERGFAEATTTSVAGDMRFLLRLACSRTYGESVSSRLPGASLRAVGGKPLDEGRRKVGFQVNKNHASGRSLISASLKERRGSLLIQRGVFGSYRAGVFRYGRSLDAAGVHPPAPFSGGATFRRGTSGPNRWTGSLEADFPGRPDVPLAGPGFEANAVHTRITRRQIEAYD